MGESLSPYSLGHYPTWGHHLLDNNGTHLPKAPYRPPIGVCDPSRDPKLSIRRVGISLVAALRLFSFVDRCSKLTPESSCNPNFKHILANLHPMHFYAQSEDLQTKNNFVTIFVSFGSSLHWSWHRGGLHWFSFSVAHFITLLSAL